jgi:hypothetical protein
MGTSKSGPSSLPRRQSKEHEAQGLRSSQETALRADEKEPSWTRH